jgi:LCP family protein required for cell wall assembly
MARPQKSFLTNTRKRRRRRGRHSLPRWRYYVRRTVAAMVVLALLCGLTVGAALGYARYQFDRVNKVQLSHLRVLTPAQHAKPDTSENILIVGNNTRIGQTEGFFGTVQQDGGARSDVTMVLHLDPATGAATLLSIPRDLFIPLPPHSMSGAVGKIDASLNDGANNLIAAVTGSLGIPIDHYVEIDFDGFQNVINAIGGIQMDFPMPLRDSLSGLNITQPGCQLLTGAQALAVVRARHLEYYTGGQWNYDPLSDLSRIRRDQAFLKVLVNTIKAKGLNNPIRAEQVLNSLVKDITIDSGFSESSMISLGTEYRNITPSTVPTLTLPVTVVNSYNFGAGNFGDVDFPTQPQDAQVVAQFLGTPPPAPTPGPSIDIQDISGIPGSGTTAAHKLVALGFTVSSTIAKASPATPTESVVRYPPGGLTQAQSVLAALSGAAILYADSTVASGHILLQVGSVVSVSSPAPPTPPASPSTKASPAASPSTKAAPTSAASPVPSPTPSVPTPGNQAITPSVFPPQPYDPTACPGT